VNADILLWTATYVLLTLVVNAPSLGLLMHYLGLNKVTADQEKDKRYALRRLKQFTYEAARRLREQPDEFLLGADWETVLAYVQHKRSDPRRSVAEQLAAPMATLSRLSVAAFGGRPAAAPAGKAGKGDDALDAAEHGAPPAAEASADEAASSDGGGGWRLAPSPSSLSLSASMEFPVLEDVLAGVEKTLRGMMSRHGRMQLDASLGSITVSDSFINVQAMERHLDSINRQLSRQVALTVEVLQITLSNENQSGIDWNFVTNTAKLGTLSFNGPPALAKNSGGIGFVKSGESGAENFLLLRALEKFGRVSTSYSSVITTMNRQAVPLGSVSTQSYLKQSTPAITTSAAGLAVVGQAGLTPGEIVTGFTLNLLPIVLDSNHVLMQASINLSSLKDLATFTSGTGSAQQSIQQPNISTFTTQQKMMVKSGDTIVLSGFENESAETRESDLVRKTVPGTKDNVRNKTTLVVLITPRLLN
jgi:type IVB pilus formation R64 PilN family outer membrane protein